MSTNAAIGFFDSGVGGLSVLRHGLDKLAGLPLIYVADSAHAPYGGLPVQQVLERSHCITGFLVEQGVQAVVVACNTATAVAVDSLRKEFALPIVGMEPAVKPASRLSHSGKIAVLATQGTLHSERYARLVSDHGQSIEAHACVCHHWVAAVEAGAPDVPNLHDMIAADLEPLLRAGVDTFVLGCTHFPFLEKTIREVIGDDACLIDPGPAVIEQLCRRIGLPTQGRRQRSEVRAYASATSTALDRHLERLLGLAVTSQPLSCGMDGVSSS